MNELYEKLFGTGNVTIISNEFLSQYLSDTKPEYLKVFLFYLWKGIKEHYSIEDASNEIDLDENTIEMALKFWIKKQLINSDCLIKNETTPASAPVVIEFNKKKTEMINKNRKSYEDIEKDLLFVAEKLLGQTVSERQQALIYKCYNDYFFDESLIQYLFEYCSSLNQTDARYMGAVASSWYEQGIKNIDAAKKLSNEIANGNKKGTKKAGVNRALDRKDDIDKLFDDAVASGKFK